MKYKISLIIIGVILVGLIGFSLKEKINLGGSADLAVFQGTATNSSSTIGTTAKLIVAQNSGRNLLKICNSSSTILYIFESTTSTNVTAEAGQILNTIGLVESCYRTGYNTGYVYTGQIWSLTKSGTSTATIFER